MKKYLGCYLLCVKYHSLFSPPLSLCDLGAFIQNLVEYIICVVTFVYCVLLYEKDIYKVGNDDDEDDAKDDVKTILSRNTINIVMSLFLFYLTPIHNPTKCIHCW